MLINAKNIAPLGKWPNGIYVWPETLVTSTKEHTFLWWQVQLPLKDPILRRITQLVVRPTNQEVDIICL